MRKHLLPLLPLVLMLLLVACQRVEDSQADKAASAAKAQAEKAQAEEASQAPDKPEAPDGCSPAFRALFDHAVVELHGEGDLDVVVATDPLCWHCRLAHKLLGEYPELYGRLRYLFFPRRSFIGSDMAAWVLEDSAGTARLGKMVDYAYTDLKQPKTDDLMTARMIVLTQFTQVFPGLLDGTTMADLYVRLQREHEPHVDEGAAMARKLELPGTPVLVGGDRVVLGFGPGVWLKTLGAAKMCK